MLHVIDRLNVGGPALIVSTLLEELDPTRFDQRLLAGSVERSELDHLALRNPRVEVHTVPGLGRRPDPIRDVQAFVGIAQVIREFRPHIVHTNKIKAGVLGRLAALMLRVPVTAHTFHGHLLHGYFSKWGTTAVTAVERVFARRTTCLLAVGARVRDDLLEAGIGRREQYAVLAPGIHAPRQPSRAEARGVLGLPGDVPVVGFVGRLTGIKRPDRFLDMADRLAPGHPDAVFVLAGGGELHDDLRARARDSRSDVRFVGWRSDVETVYAASDVVVLTSDNEGMPLSLVEAAWAGRPAVSTRVGATPEVVLDGVTGFVTEPDSRELAAATDRLLQDPTLREEMGRRAAERAHLEYSAARMAQRVADLYEELVARAPSRRRPPGFDSTLPG